MFERWDCRSGVQAPKRAMGEKDPVAPGASRGETPRLRILDQTLRQSGNKKKKKKISYPFIPLISFVLSGRAVHFVSCWYSSAVGIKSFLMDYLFVIFNWNR
jgi:hypothetical protein